MQNIWFMPNFSISNAMLIKMIGYLVIFCRLIYLYFCYIILLYIVFVTALFLHDLLHMPSIKLVSVASVLVS